MATTLTIACALSACGTDGGDREPQLPPSALTTALAPVTTAPAPTTTALVAAPSTTMPPLEAPTTTVAPPTTVAPTTVAVTVPEPVYAFTSSELSTEVIERVVPTSWREGCPVELADLRYLQLTYWGFDDAPHTGELIVHADAVDVMQDVFATLFAERFPISSMRLVDDFGGDDFQSIEADNTSAFNCRTSTGSSTNWSQHAYGRAIDINPIENPYVSDGQTEHPASVPYLDRSDARPGMIVAGGPAVVAFDEHGWGWGGRWNDPQDWQHFSATGR